MSYPYRQPVGSQPSVPVGQAPLRGRMVSPICTTGSPSVFPLMSNSYRFLSQQPQQYITQPVVYTLQNVQNTSYVTSAVTSTMPRMFVPVASVPGGISSASDPAKLLEEQRRYEKERNFQLQQERLKQFTIAGKKGSINAENLIDSMFGKFQPKKSSGDSIPFLPAKIHDATDMTAKAALASNETSSVSYNTASVSTKSFDVPINKDAKELDSMMFESSDLIAPLKATKFSESSVKEMPSSSSHVTTFPASNKSRDWRNIKGLDDMFTVSKPRFPSWCVEDKVPELFRKIQAAVTNNDKHLPDTNLLFPILISSGLPREMLGQIWEIVNESASGQLTVNEMYAILALIALAQASYPVKTIDVLHQLPSCPCPQLSISTEVSNKLKQSCSSLAPASINTETSIFHSKENQSQTIRPTAISLTNIYQVTNDPKDAASWKPLTDSATSQDDDFDEFKSATPMAINFAISTPTSIPSTEDDFDDFKQASCVQVSETTNTAFSNSLYKFAKEEYIGDINIQQDLMSPEEDKYSAFRSLQQNAESNKWSDFTFSAVSKEVGKKLSVNEGENVEVSANEKDSSTFVTQNQNIASCFKKHVKIENCEEDEFGDFIRANPSCMSSLLPETTITDFADFANFSQPDCGQPVTSQLDDEFGEFASSMFTPLKPEFGQECLFRHLKDNISLTESQSVSSLELGTFDGGGGHSGESKSSLSRQGSIPSLDLKSIGLDGTDSEDCFAEIQLPTFIHRNSKSPSPVTNNKGSDDNESFSTPVFQASLPFTDKYSVIRQEKVKEEDQYITCWIRCLQSCINILQNTKKILNQMSCSSVFNEVLTSEEGGNYVKNIVEVYKVMQRIGLASKSVNRQTEMVVTLLKEADQVWNTISGFFAGSVLMPEETSLDFSSAIFKLDPENSSKACGLCLLSVELQSKSLLQEEHTNLSYGGRKYHSPCANFWVNCVDPLLPALTLPPLL